MISEPNVMDKEMQANLDEAKFTPRQMKVLAKILGKIHEDMQKSDNKTRKENLDWGMIGKHYDRITAVEKVAADLNKHNKEIGDKFTAHELKLASDAENMNSLIATQKIVQVAIGKLLDENMRRNDTIAQLLEKDIKKDEEDKKLRQVLQNLVENIRKLNQKTEDLTTKNEMWKKKLNEVLNKLYLPEVGQ